jgi:two-component system torCAD operon response regulator TorR
MAAPTILVVEDSPESLELIAGYLESQGIRTLRAATAAQMTDLLATERPSLILLDVNLPDGDGIALASKLRLGERCGLIFVTSRDTDDDVIAGLEAGGDDYVTKPVNMRALHARIRSVLRRAADSVITFEGWNLDLIRRELFQPNGRMVELTTGEFNILAALAAQRPNPVSRDFLLDVISNRDPREVSEHTIDTLISRLRRKMQTGTAKPLIATVRGIGYALAV